VRGETARSALWILSYSSPQLPDSLSGFLVTGTNAYSAMKDIALTKAQPNKSLDASGGRVFRIMTGPAMLE
jgi:hypothetical protein